jgi:hypothetical protein
MAGIAMLRGNEHAGRHEHHSETRRTQWRNYTATQLGKCTIALPGGLDDMCGSSLLMLWRGACAAIIIAIVQPGGAV